MTARPIAAAEDTVGESIVRDDQRSRLVGVDIVARRLPQHYRKNWG